MRIFLSSIFIIIFLFSCIDDQSVLIDTGEKSDKIEDKEQREKLVSSYMSLATEALYKRSFPAAYDNLFKAEKVDSKNGDVQNLLGLIYFYDGNIEEAELKFKNATQLKENFSEAYNHLGIVYSEQKEYQKAIEAFKKATSNLLYKTPWIAYTNLGQVYIELKNYEEAEKVLLLSLRKNHKQCQAHSLLGDIYRAQSNFENSKKHYDEFLKLCPNVANIHLKIGTLMIQLKKNDEASNEFKSCVKLSSEQGNQQLLKECRDYLNLLGVKEDL
ncbi:tetratricopeptide repeat protein [bacterium]|nr:tetratricopeptide repeat protein [bacterium]